MTYAVLAKYYDQMMGDRSKEFERIRELVLKYCPKAKKVLELACGTGTFLEYFYAQGFDVTGIDLSPEMLELARNKVPRAHLSLQDIASFSLSDTFDVIVCLFDSVNHLIGYEKWEALFTKARSHLHDGGVLIFDINTVRKLERLANGQPYIHPFGDAEVSMAVTRRADGTYDWLTRIEDRGRKTVEEETIQEQSFPVEQILESLKPLFPNVVVLDQKGDLATEASDRVYFICLS